MRVFGGESRARTKKIRSFRIYRLIISNHRDLYVPPSHRADSLREINEAERSGCVRGRVA